MMKEMKPVHGKMSVSWSVVCVLLVVSVLIVSGCSRDKGEEKPSVTAPAEQPSEEKTVSPVQSLKQMYDGMGDQETLDRINGFIDESYSLDRKDGALWLVAPNGNEANLAISDLMHQPFTKDGVDYHRYFFSLKNIGNPEQLAPFQMVTEEENHGEMIHALQHLQELARE